jgi:hypothetical protein
MNRTLTALAMLALVGAGCGSNAASETGSAGTAHEKAMKFSACMRDNGVAQFPDPDASGAMTLDGVVNGSSLDPSSATWTKALAACKDLQPAGFTGKKATPKEQSVRLKFAQCMRDNGIKDFPDPAADGPLIDTNRMPGAPAAHSIPGFDAAAHKCIAAFSGELGLKRQ